MFDKMGANYAANLPAYDSKELQVILGTLVSDYVITVYRRQLNMHLILNIDSDVDLCRTITYLCEDDSGLADISDSAIDGPLKDQHMSAPKVKTFNGFCKGGFRYKLAVEQLECINQSDILKNWFNYQLATSIDNGRQAIMARFYRFMMVHAHPKNTGNNAGMLYGGNVVGSTSEPVIFNAANADKFMMSLLATIKQMPKGPTPNSEFMTGVGDDAYFFGPSIMENVLMQTEAYNSYDSVGSCGACALFKDTFHNKPRGLMPITGDCVESYTCTSAGANHTVYPVLFGKRYKGAKASLRIKTYNWMSGDAQSVFYQTTFYHHMHVYDPCYIGLAYVVIEQEQPATIASCDVGGGNPGV